MRRRWINSQTWSVLGAFALGLASCSESIDELSPAQQNLVLDEVATLIEREYVIDEGAALLTASLTRARADGLFDDARSIDEFVAQSNRVLQAAYPDRHLGLVTPARYQQIRERLGDHEAGAESKPKQGRPTLRDVAGIIGVSEISRDGLNQIGYVAFERLVGSDRSRTTIDRIFSTFSESERIIIDLRECRGGDAAMVVALSNYFFEQRTHLLSSVHGRDADGTRRVHERWTTPTPLSKAFATKPLDILVSRDTFSAGESFAFGLEARGRARIIGETTGGGGFSNDFFELSEGLAVSISIGRSYDPKTGEGWQGAGIAPNIVVERDHALSETIAHITRESGKLAALSPEQQAIHGHLQAYTHAWYNSDGSAMAELITPDFEASYAKKSGTSRRDHDGQVTATRGGMGTQQKRLYHNRIIRGIEVDGTHATASLVLRATTHRIELRRSGKRWLIERDDYKDKTRSGV